MVLVLPVEHSPGRDCSAERPPVHKLENNYRIDISFRIPGQILARFRLWETDLLMMEIAVPIGLPGFRRRSP